MCGTCGMPRRRLLGIRPAALLLAGARVLRRPSRRSTATGRTSRASRVHRRRPSRITRPHRSRTDGHQEPHHALVSARGRDGRAASPAPARAGRRGSARGSCAVDDEVGGRPGSAATGGPASPAPPSWPRRAASGCPAACSAATSSAIRPCAMRAARVGARVDRHARPPPPVGPRRPRRRAARACARRRSGTRDAESAMPGNVSTLISVGTSAVPRRAISAIRSSVRPVPCSMQSMPALIRPGQRGGAEHVRGDPRARRVRGVDGGDQHVVGPERGEVALAPVDPVAHQLDPAVAGRGLLGDDVGQQRRIVELDGRPRGCSAWAGPGAGPRG